MSYIKKYIQILSNFLDESTTHFRIFFQIMAIFSGNILLDLLGVIISLFAVIYTFFQWNYQTWRRKSIPYFKPKFPYGNLPSKGKQKSDSETMFDVVEKAKEQGKQFIFFITSFVNTNVLFVILSLCQVRPSSVNGEKFGFMIFRSLNNRWRLHLYRTATNYKNVYKLMTKNINNN